MARYQVPQFIEVEDKIFGPLTFKQFIYLAGGGGLSLAFFTLLPFWLAVIFIIPVAVFAAALAFYEVNVRPFIVVLEHAFGYLLGNKLYFVEASHHKAVCKTGPGSRLPTAAATGPQALR